MSALRLFATWRTLTGWGLDDRDAADIAATFVKRSDRGARLVGWR
jgi:hypothetical protein